MTEVSRYTGDESWYAFLESLTDSEQSHMEDAWQESQDGSPFDTDAFRRWCMQGSGYNALQRYRASKSAKREAA